MAASSGRLSSARLSGGDARKALAASRRIALIAFAARSLENAPPMNSTISASTSNSSSASVNSDGFSDQLSEADSGWVVCAPAAVMSIGASSALRGKRLSAVKPSSEP
ncbi:hypothetical protein D3C87_1620900 [compost metagenome]